MKAAVQTLCLAALLTGAGELQAQELAQPQIEACDVEFTELGKLATFRLSVAYTLQTDESGTIMTVSVAQGHQEHRDRLAGFVRLDQLEKCFLRWKLRPQTTYEVRFEAGTTSDRICAWPLWLCQGPGECTALTLTITPRGSTVAGKTPWGDATNPAPW